MERFLEAAALALVFEGVILALCPEMARKAFLEAASLSRQRLRAMGGAALALALILIFLLRLWR